MQDKQTVNGRFSCNFLEDAVTQITETHESISSMHDDIKHLKTIADTLEEIKEGLLGAVLGKEIVPIAIATTMLDNQKNSYEQMLKGQRESYVSIIKVLCWVTLVAIAIFSSLRHLAPQWFGGA